MTKKKKKKREKLLGMIYVFFAWIGLMSTKLSHGQDLLSLTWLFLPHYYHMQKEKKKIVKNLPHVGLGLNANDFDFEGPIVKNFNSNAD